MKTAKTLLKSINARMTKAQMLREISVALNELDLFDIHEVAEQVGGKVANVRARCINNGLGEKVGRMGRVYTAHDVREVRRIMAGGHTQGTLALIAEIKMLKAKGMPNVGVAKKLGIDPSYVTKLLK
ncbi:MAG: hypothetical protein GY743_23545 [Planctomycetaceae bacterium]|nr:hypothetical protein [Planctomycetaceae bacterium]